jgi:hypothetical protein
MADNSNYRVILEALLDLTKVQEQIEKLKKTTINIGVNVEGAAQQVEQAHEKIAKRVKKYDKSMFINDRLEQQTFDQFQQRVENIKNSVDALAKVDISTSVNKKGETITSAILRYKDDTGKVVTETMRWRESTKKEGDELVKISKWQSTNLKYSDDIAKSQQKQTNEVKQTSNEIRKINVLAGSFLEKTKNMNQGNRNVRQGASIAKEIQSLIQYDQVSGTYTTNNIVRLRELEDALRMQNSAVAALGKMTLGWANEVKIAIQRTIEWSFSIGLVYGALNQLREGVQYIKDLNKEMTNIQIVSDMTNEEIRSLGKTYNGLAKELGSTTLEISRGALEFQRAGKSIEETEQLMRVSTMMSKMAALDAAEATELTISIMNGFKFQASDMMGVLDKLTQLDNNYATSLKEISQAMQRSANSAQMANITFDQLASYIAITSSVTRKSAESIGESFNSGGVGA